MKSLIQAYQMAKEFTNEDWESPQPDVQPATFWQCFLANFIPLATCEIRGHQWNSCASAENGTEDIWCQRCGYSMHHQF